MQKQQTQDERKIILIRFSPKHTTTNATEMRKTTRSTAFMNHPSFFFNSM